jgi:ubiquinone/menaquinone biosynthesis C-methylase UbiE
MRSFVDFPWPTVGEGNEKPIWTGNYFQVASRQFKILRFGETGSGWSPALTEMHEKEARSSHPIDLASRAMAIDSMRLLKGWPGPIILDVGCSSGFLVEELSRALPEANVIGADYLPELVLKGAQRCPHNPFLQFDLRHCPLPDACLDGITALNVLEHIDDDDKALSEIHRVLKSGGLAHIEVPADPSSFDLYDEVLLHYRRYRLPDIVAKAKTAGFAIRKATYLGFFVYPIFKYTKKRNQQRGSGLSLEEKRQLVAHQIGDTNKSRVLAAVFAFEKLLGSIVNYPTGIRTILRLGKQ